jgi:arylsulfatase A-like enzyme
MVGAHEAIPPPYNTPETDYLAKLRREVMGLWEEGSDDILTFHMVSAFVQKNQPRVLWWALKDSDDWAHADRYDRYLEFLHMADRLIGELWNTIQAMDFYRDKTTLIITGDHGRGLQGKDWAEHDITIPGSDDIWLAVIGPDTPDLGEMTTPGTVYQGQVAATILHYLGVDYLKLDPKALPPVLPGD